MINNFPVNIFNNCLLKSGYITSYFLCIILEKFENCVAELFTKEFVLIVF